MWCRNPEILDELDIDEETKSVLLQNIKRRLTPQAVKIRAGKIPAWQWITMWIEMNYMYCNKMNYMYCNVIAF